MEYLCRHPQEVEELAPGMLELMGETRLVLCYGDLGAGKTTLIKALCREIGIQEEVTSPTFSLINEYHGASGVTCFHIDLYRLDTLDEAVQIGIEEYLRGSGWCFIEWPELITSLIETPFIEIHIQLTGESHRKFRILKRTPATD